MRYSRCSSQELPNLSQFWSQVQSQACGCPDPLISDLYAVNICDHSDFPSALASLLGAKLADRSITESTLTRLVAKCIEEDISIAGAACEDILATYERDPACTDLVTPFLFFKGWQALQAYRISHFLWKRDRRPLAYHFQSRINERFGIDIHPAAQIGKGLTIDHGTAIVIGETCIIGNNVSLFQGVTLGGTGKSEGERHPVIRESVMIGAGAKILGRLEVGAHARIGAASVVLEDIPPYATAVGNPARIVRVDTPGSGD
ncbi:serine O-acetyltransferase [Acetobacteraceae bacterium ESL0709]|nr:serine O-acetyltransferase [Acetobacteraceae bacterium ESL0697]MDF7678740.1 serine O-acetyltransferase [Acetobacteraceae bacterium ESL0709]